MPETNPPAASSEPAKSKIHSSLYVYPICAFVNTTVVTAVTHPFDKALYHATTQKKPFFTRANFAKPYKCVMASATQKMTFGNTYYIFQGIMRDRYDEQLSCEYNFSKNQIAFINGVVAGSVNGIISNPFSAAKYHSWDPCKGGFLRSVRDMWKAGGFEPFMRGTSDGILREIFGSAAYEVTRGALRAHFVPHGTDEKGKATFNAGFLCDLAGAATGTVLGGPFNFTRNEKYKAPADKHPPTTKAIMTQIWDEAKQKPKKALGKTGFFAHRFNVGWGTLLTAAKMASSQAIYDYVRSALMPNKGENEQGSPTCRR
ncbi:MAG: hypothetical protein P4M14_11155 [Gammaproteobacteria bacterium]|nr:hypothetical protein [Gammaproteobacteria bacterium]